jgi:hypothetical protein
VGWAAEGGGGLGGHKRRAHLHVPRCRARWDSSGNTLLKWLQMAGAPVVCCTLCCVNSVTPVRHMQV